MTEGTSAKLDCVVGGVPLPTVVWLRNNQPITDSENHKTVVEGDVSTLQFVKVKCKDGGQYTAKASNVNGSILSTADLVVIEGQIRFIAICITYY